MRHRVYRSVIVSNFLSSRSAAAAVEFAMLLPVFLTLMMGLAAYGIYFGATHSVQQIAADAARSALAGLTETERSDIVTQYIADNAGDYPFIDPARLTATARDSAADGNQFVVTVSYDASQLPIWHLLTTIAMPDVTIRRQSTIRVGGI